MGISKPGFEAEIAVGENADQSAVLGDGYAGDLYFRMTSSASLTLSVGTW